MEAFENLVELRQTMTLTSTSSATGVAAAAVDASASADVSASVNATMGTTGIDDLEQSVVIEADQLLGSFQGMVTSLLTTMRAQVSALSPPLAASGKSSARRPHGSSGLDISMDSSIFGADQSSILGSELQGSSQGEVAIAAFLDRYSDRFADLVSEKVAKKLESTMNSSGLVSPPL